MPELVPAGVVGVCRVGRRALEGQREGADEGGQGGDSRDEAAGLKVGEAAELVADGDQREPGGGEGGERGEPDGAVGTRGSEPLQALDPVRGESEQGGQGARDEDEPLESARVSVDGEVAGEGSGPGPGEERGDDGESAAAGCHRSRDGRREGDEARLCAVGRGTRSVRGRGLCRHRCHALSATRSPRRPCGLTRSTTMRSTKAQTSAQDWPPSCCMPGISLMYAVAMVSATPRARPPSMAP